MIASANSAAAQTASQVLPPTREEVTRPDTTAPTPRAPRLEVEGGIERAPCALDSPDLKDIRFTLRDVQFEGLQGLTVAELAPAYAPLVGSEQPISVVCEVRDRAATILREAGYIAAVQVPEQRIADGVVRFRVLMAKITGVRVRGNASGAERTIAGYLNQLAEKPVFNRYEAERYLLLASDLPGYNVRLTLRPAGTAPGEVIGDVTVQRITAFADANIQNSGSRELGRFGGLLRGQLYGLTGLADRTTVSMFSTSDFEEQQTIQVGHDFRLGAEGLSASGSFTYAWANPSVPDADVKARTLLGTAEIGYPFVRRQASTVRGSLGLDIINQDVELDDIDLTRDRLRVGFARVGWDAVSMDFSKPGRSLVEPFWRVSNLVELRKGLNIFGASDDCGPEGDDCLDPGDIPPSRLEGQSDALVLRYSGYGELRPARLVTVALGARAQYAWDGLLSFEEFSAGNYTVGRGYDPGALLGDRGYGTQVELRIGSRVPASAKSVAIEGYGFWDHAKVQNIEELVEVDQPNRLHSVGAGARLLFNRFALDTALAVPLSRIGVERERPAVRLLISLTTRLWPWSFR
ncbi:ShlB/FhaC/HecB family hemolysin secretion/activation protein [Sphingomonas lutea]|uniref:ShlB/FhaC/HecB family hemolysin secretion/activation protein n=1 Tax=Sphingomonas lutea TaxID=1045317 RepID=A0A7G9SJV3_9SPHN|nr:ShlB/FhaC/HecB family hemolysin secretion/activation protein [Sphingomonas lutea]QNN68128.1 ShlB/FhaC/HecB family hemolysin secretion/activation protein [Sphingomonas lutea]